MCGERVRGRERGREKERKERERKRGFEKVCVVSVPTYVRMHA